jgi:hypothetical protein
MFFAVFSVLALLAAWKYYPSILSYLLNFLAISILIFVAFSPLRLRPLYKLWLKVAHAIGKLNTQILLGIIFILIFIPVGLVMHLAGRDTMKRKRANKATYWERYTIEGLTDRKRYERQF